MLRKKLMEHHSPDGFRWRGGEISRIEGLSDAVFGFAVTLLVVSLEVPKTFDELAVLLRGFIPFAICFALLMQVWHEQYSYFRRYNLQDGATLFLNLVLLFVVIFYVYPLKFLFTVLVNVWTGQSLNVHLPNGTIEAMIQENQISHLMEIFSAGYLAVSCVFMLLFGHALRKREELELNAIEILETRASMGGTIIQAGISLVSLMIAVFGGPGLAGWAGMIYPILIAPGLTIFYTIVGRKRRKLREQAAETTATPAV